MNARPGKSNRDLVSIGAAALIGGLLGSIATWFLKTHTLALAPERMSYADLSATLLSAVSVLMTILGVFVALLAIWGYSQFKAFASAAATEHVDTQLKEGALRGHVEAVVKEYLEAEFKTGPLRKLVEERIDYVIFSGASERAAEASDAEHEE